MQAASLEKLETARALANEFANSMNLKEKEEPKPPSQAAVSEIQQQTETEPEKAATKLDTAQNEPNQQTAENLEQFLQNPARFGNLKTTDPVFPTDETNNQVQPQDADTSAKTAIIENEEVSNKPENTRINLGARYDADERNSTPKITAFEVAHWRNRLWLNPFLALSALLWFPFMTGLFSELLPLNLAALGVISFIEYRLTRKTCRALHTVKAPLWQRSWIAYIIRRGLVISLMLAVFILAIPFESWLVAAYLASVAVYWIAQLYMLRKRRRKQQQQLAQFA